MISTDIIVERIHPDNFAVIEDALRDVSSPALLGYHTPAYMNMLTLVLHDNPLYLAAFINNKIAGFMPIRWRTGRLGPVINGLPFFGPNGGPVLTEHGQPHENSILSRLAEELMLFARETGAISVVCYTPFMQESRAFESTFAANRVVERFTQYLDLNGFTGWSAHIRHKSVGRAKAKGVTTRLGSTRDIPKLLEIYNAHYGRKGIQVKPENYLYQVIESLCPAGIARFTVAEWKHEVVAFLITIQAGITISYNVPCCVEYALTTQANSLLIDEAVRALSARGYRYWNWEASASRDHPVYKFKSRWGSLECDYTILIKYPLGAGVFSGCDQQEIADQYPFYFVIPFDDLSKF